MARRNAQSSQAGGAGGSTTYEALKGADKAWFNLRNMPTGRDAGPAPAFVRDSSEPIGKPCEFDVAVCGGTLGVFFACALQLAGLRVAIVERGPLRGRAQEWNISRKELNELAETGVLTAHELQQCTTSEFNPVRVGFKGGAEVWTRDVLNLGVRPDKMIDIVAARFREAGGTVLDETAASGVTVHSDGVAIYAPARDAPITTRLLVDSMGHASPIARQLRHGKKPDGVCCVVGTVARGFDPSRNTTSDVIYTTSDIGGASSETADLQYFWEAFPAGSDPSDRTTYMFTYLDADPRRPSLEALLEDYWKLMPEYQEVELEKLQVQRVLFGFFPTYRDSPLPAGFDRVLQIGDASGIQSPLSFGGFGALSRHLPRLTAAVSEAIEADTLDRKSISSINAYNPGLSAAWMLQRAMSVRPGQKPQPSFINKLLTANFAAMEARGDAVMRPFLQDVIKFGPMGQALLGQMRLDPASMPAVMRHVGLLALLDWMRHFFTLGLYDLSYRVLRPLRRRAEAMAPARKFKLNRFLDALEYGSGNDYRL